jgi:hypothetical protein
MAHSFTCSSVVTMVTGNKCCLHTSTVAIKRCYENLRRTHLEQQPGKEDFCKEQSLTRKYRSRRERVKSSTVT